jgi:hypothetical protein
MEEEAKLSYRVMGCTLITGSKQRTVRNYVVFPSHKTRKGTKNETTEKNNRFHVACVYRPFVNKVCVLRVTVFLRFTVQLM